LLRTVDGYDRGNSKATEAKKTRHIKRLFKLAVNRNLMKTRHSILLCRNRPRKRSILTPMPNYYIQNVPRPKGKWTLTDARLKVVNNFRHQFNIILKKAGVKKGTFHDIRRIAISMWFSYGMSEHDAMVLAGHASFATTHEFYLAVAGDLIHRTRTAIAEGLCQTSVRFSTRPFRA
jgi:integrase